MMKKVALCLVDREEKVDAIVDELKKIGFSKKEISVLHADSKDKEKSTEKTQELNQRHHQEVNLTQAGAVSGASVGAITGSALGLLAGLGVMTIPGIGPFIAAGPVMTALSALLSGTAVGSGVGLIAGALVGMGIHQPHAEKYEEFIKSGRILIAVEADTEKMLKQALNAYNDAGALEIHPKLST